MPFPNKVRARCAKCGLVVEVGAGRSDKTSGHWVTTHDSCPPTRAYSMFEYDTEPDYGYAFRMRPVDWQEACNPDEGDKG